MRVFALVLLSFLLINAALLANPFIGKWTADEVTVVISDTTLTVTVDSDNEALGLMRGTWSYTYDNGVIRAGELAAVYAFSPDGDQAIIMCFLGDESVRIHFFRAEPLYHPQKESFGT